MRYSVHNTIENNMSKNGITIFNNNEYFTAFPHPSTVFASEIEKHLQYFLPLASVDLSKIKPEWEDIVHFIVPIEPEDGVLGETTEEFYTYYSRDNWVGFRNSERLCVFEGSWNLFVKDTIPDYYKAALDGFNVAKKHFNAHGALHIVDTNSDEEGEGFDSDEPLELVEQLGGECFDNNWANMGNFDISRTGNWVYTDHDRAHDKKKVRPLTEDGRPFEYIGVINASSYNMNEDADFTWADSLLFYDPVTKISLLTFDWS